MRGSVSETYQAALQHGLFDPSDATLVGVVRRPPGWFRASVDENVPDLGPPGNLLDETKSREEEFKMAGMCGEEAHNAAWEEADFADRYRTHLESDPAAAEALESLAARVDAGEDVVLVCFEGEDKRCHRHILQRALECQLEN